MLTEYTQAYEFTANQFFKEQTEKYNFILKNKFVV